MASMAHRVAKGLVGGCAVLLGVVVTGCAAPQYTYVANSDANTYFKVPYGWHKISDIALSAALKAATGSSGGAWTVAYEAGAKPTAGDFLSFDTDQPFVFAEVGDAELHGEPASCPTTRCAISSCPSPPPPGRTRPTQGFPLTGFAQIRDETLTLGQGVHGVRETFDYTASGHGRHLRYGRPHER